MRIVIGVCMLAIIGLGTIVFAEAKPDSQSGLIEMTCRKQGDNELIEVKFGDVRFLSEELTFEHDDGTSTVVKTRGGRVEIEGHGVSGMSKLFGKTISVSMPKGILSRRPKADIR